MASTHKEGLDTVELALCLRLPSSHLRHCSLHSPQDGVEVSAGGSVQGQGAPRIAVSGKALQQAC